MKRLKLQTISLVLMLCFEVNCDFFTAFGTAFGLKCRFDECCTKEWIPNNFTELKTTLEKRLFGQHFVMGPVIKHLKGHANYPIKALVLSLHGATGTGKTFVGKLVAESMFKEGLKSRYVHLFVGKVDFPHPENSDQYKDTLQEKIRQAVTECPQSLFIFDEIEDMPEGILDTIKPYFDHHERIDGVDYRKTTFLLLSNTGGFNISNYVIEQWFEGRDRESIQLKELEKVIRTTAFNVQGQALWHSDLIKSNLITAHIPFLPLERGHVKQCIRQAMVERGFYREVALVSEAKVQEVLDQLTFYPDDVKLYSTTGCKRVNDKVDLIMEN